MRDAVDEPVGIGEIDGVQPRQARAHAAARRRAHMRREQHAEALPDVGGNAGVARRLALALAGQRRLVQAVGLQLVAALFQPVLDDRLVDLDVELQPPGAPADAEGLARPVAAREQRARRRHVERVVVPLEGREPTGQAAEQRVVPGGRRQRDVVPADLGLQRDGRAAAGGLGQQLAAEAEAERRQAGLERGPQEVALGPIQSTRSSWSGCATPPSGKRPSSPWSSSGSPSPRSGHHVTSSWPSRWGVSEPSSAYSSCSMTRMRPMPAIVDAPL